MYFLVSVFLFTILQLASANPVPQAQGDLAPALGGAKDATLEANDTADQHDAFSLVDSELNSLAAFKSNLNDLTDAEATIASSNSRAHFPANTPGIVEAESKCSSVKSGAFGGSAFLRSIFARQDDDFCPYCGDSKFTGDPTRPYCCWANTGDVRQHCYLC